MTNAKTVRDLLELSPPLSPFLSPVRCPLGSPWHYRRAGVYRSALPDSWRLVHSTLGSVDMGLWQFLGVLALSVVIFVCMLDTDWKRKLLRHHGEKNS